MHLFIQPTGALSCPLRLLPLFYLFNYSSCPLLFRSLTMSSVGFLFIYLFIQSVLQTRDKCAWSWIIYLFNHSPTRSTRWSCCTSAHPFLIYLFIRRLGHPLVFFIHTSWVFNYLFICQFRRLRIVPAVPRKSNFNYLFIGSFIHSSIHSSFHCNKWRINYLFSDPAFLNTNNGSLLTHKINYLFIHPFVDPINQFFT